jgi:glutamate dehydrogenase/leucine dehydrogenase
VRSAPSILQSGAANLARSVTYSFAAFEVQAGGASAGVNAKPPERAEALAAFVAEVAPRVESGSLLLDPGRGVAEGDLAPLRSADPRPTWLWAEEDGVTGAEALVAAGALSAADAVGRGVDGASVAIEGFGGAGLAVARAVAERGGKVVSVATAAGSATEPSGFDVATLAEGWASGGEGLTKAVGGTVGAAADVFSSGADVLFVGSRPGVLTHEAAEPVTAGAVVPLAPVPYTTKALLQLQRAGAAVVPCFLSVAGPLLVGAGVVSDQRSSAIGEVGEGVATLVKAASAHADGLFLGACAGAEAFLRTWRSTLPFGRPLA